LGGEMSDKYQRLEHIKKLLDDGVLSEEEYQDEKTKILAEPLTEYNDYSTEDEEAKHWGLDEKTFCLVMHLGQFAGYAVPLAGLILPIVMWVSEKDNSQKIDAHGRIILNWIISSIIYGTIFAILIFFFVGIPLFIALVICWIVFPIIGAIKAADGIIWHYPLTISFFAIPDYYDDDDEI
jgi:uncharacterized Tic20 family protein